MSQSSSRTTRCRQPAPARRRSRTLQPTFFKQLRTATLAACQFPPVLSDAKGEIYKPARW
jgi:hypothetical protein